MKRGLGYSLLLLSLVALTTGVAAGQNRGGSMNCRDSWFDGDRLQSHCEITEQTIPAGGIINVDAGKNGGVAVKGSNRTDVLVRARIQTAALTTGEAEQLAKQIRIDTAGGRISGQGPDQQDNNHWSVSFEVLVPNRTDLSLAAHNGGISISDVTGKIDFKCLNGGVNLNRVGGNVHGSTTNGGLNVILAGDRWDGEELDVKTTNGGVNMSVPENYSAHLETGTVNGNVSVDFPVTVQGRITKEISLNLGGGGATVRAMTTNGGVRLQRSTHN